MQDAYETHDMPWVIFGSHPSQHGGLLKLLFISWLIPQHVRLDFPYIVFVHHRTSQLAERTLIFELGAAGPQTAESCPLYLCFCQNLLKAKKLNLLFYALIDNRENAK